MTSIKIPFNDYILKKFYTQTPHRTLHTPAYPYEWKI
jgi:hypothetical protein